MKRIILNFSLLIIAVVLQICNTLNAQNLYQYKVNLKKFTDDELKVDLIAPKINKAEIVFHLAKIVPGTYINSDFGKFIHDLKTFNKEGKQLAVILLPDSNSWKIKNANRNRCKYRRAIHNRCTRISQDTHLYPSSYWLRQDLPESFACRDDRIAGVQVKVWYHSKNNL